MDSKTRHRHGRVANGAESKVGKSEQKFHHDMMAMSRVGTVLWDLDGESSPKHGRIGMNATQCLLDLRCMLVPQS